jgi:Zn-finger nucleic acid-binding protein
VSATDSRCAHCGGTLIDRVCPRCFAAVSDQAKHCAACGAEILLAARAQGPPTPRSCPRCRQPLVSLEVAGQPFERCPACGGLWVDRQIFERLVATGQGQPTALPATAPEPAAPLEPAEPAKNGPARAGPAPFYLNCPECGTVMGRTNFARRSGVLMDRCPGHGVWFDRDELSRVLAFVRSGGKARAELLERERRKKDDSAARAARAGSESDSLRGLDGATLATILQALARRFGRRRS